MNSFSQTSMCYFIKRKITLNFIGNNFKVIENQINAIVFIDMSFLNDRDWRKIENRYINRFTFLDKG